MDDWAVELQRGRAEAAWDRFLDRYRKLIFAAIRHYAEDYDDVMDVFARVCEALREDDFRRLRSYLAQAEHRARFSTWLVTVVRHLTIDWFRSQDGRRRVTAIAERLPPLQRRIFEHVFLQRRSHVETYELIRCTDAPEITFRQYLAELRATYHGVMDGRRGHVLRELSSQPPPPAEIDVGAPVEVPSTEERQLLEQALNTLSTQDRLVLDLYVQNELPAENVATIVGLPNAKAVYNRVYRALADLRQHLEKVGFTREDL
jgi:DNA-directed RNA polymerase specialized sigma24 family protein